MLEVFSTEISAVQPSRVTVNRETPKTSAGLVAGYRSFQSRRAVWSGALTVAGTVTVVEAQPATPRATSARMSTGRMQLIVAQAHR